MAFCTDVLAKVKATGTGLVAEPLYCRRWNCELCADRRQRELRWLARSGEPTTFLTLTVNPERLSTPAERARALRSAWRALRTAMRRRWPGERFPFLAVFERTRRGEPHLHILMRAPFVPQEWISERMDRLIGAPVVDIRFIRDRNRAAAYIAKYCSKAPRLWSGCKRYWRSMDWQLWPDTKAPKDWLHLWVVRRGINELLNDIRTTGHTVADLVGGGRMSFHWWIGQWRPLRT